MKTIGKRSKVIAAILIFGIIFFPLTESHRVDAANKKAVYMAITVPKGSVSGLDFYVRSMKVSGKKAVIKGKFWMGKSYNAINRGDYKVKKFGKYTFSLTNNCKFYGRGGDDPDFIIGKKRFIKYVNSISMGFLFYLNKDGKIYKMILTSQL